MVSALANVEAGNAQYERNLVISRVVDEGETPDPGGTCKQTISYCNDLW